MKKIMVLDANSILNRAFYGIRMLTNSQGQPTNAIYGFFNMLLKYMGQEHPDGICAAFDLRAPTFRHKFSEQYKAQRKGMPDELATQLEPTKEILRAMGIPVLSMEGYEADDIIGTISRICEEKQIFCTIISGDKDDLQLVGAYTTVKLIRTAMGKTTEEDITPEKMQELYGMTPKQFIDLKAIMGDTSDNIPGVSGIGEKGATTLIHTFGSLEAIYEQLDHPSIKPKMREKLETDKQAAFDSRYLATIDRNVPISFTPEDFCNQEPQSERLRDLLKALELDSIINRLGLEEEQKAEQPITEVTALQQGSYAYLFTEDGLEFSDGTEQFICPSPLQKEFFERKDIEKWGYDIKTDLIALKKRGISPEGITFDVMLAAYVINQADLPLSTEKVISRYGCGNTKTLGLATAKQELTKLLEEHGQKSLYDEMELPLAFVLADMEEKGVYVNKERLSELSEEYGIALQQLEQEIYQSAGMEFNINSTKQLAQVLFEHLKLPVYKKNKTGPSTNAETLERLYDRHPVIPLLLQYRQIAKLKSTYLDGMIPLVAEDGRLHTNYNQAVTQTGRLSSSEPNLQNLPIRQEQGRELRKLFTAPEGKVLLDADYSQIELRILAHMAKDSAMTQAFLEGEDIHTQTAAAIFGLPTEMVTPQIRSYAKAVNFGIVYGISDFSLSRNIGVTKKEAAEFINRYKSTYHGITAFMDETITFAREHGFVETAFGRRRYIPEIMAGNFVTRSFGERAAMNAPIQGTAADIMKLAMVRVAKKLKEGNFEAFITMQIHDELVLEVPEAEVESVSRILQEEMEGAVSFSLPLTVEMKHGNSLFETK
ncbi:MAG: DNA polymerase I [Ruminococcaceae bacterium]|nr:DNA polymerase I [Oscillospiraceae bacterium]